MRLRVFAPALAALTLSCGDPTGPGADEILALVSGDGFSCALVGESVYCWGRNDIGQLGRGLAGGDAAPGPVTGDHRFRLIGASERTVCGVTMDAEVLCWGHGRISGAADPMMSPTLIPGTFPASIASIEVGYSHGCVRATGGGATCFGTNRLGELGNGTAEPATGALGAMAVIGGHSFSQISVGAFHTCGVEGGDVWCWGFNANFSLGPGTTAGATYATPTKVTLAFAAAKVVAGSAVTCVLDATSQAWCWGTNYSGQLGRGSGSASPSGATPALVSQFSAYSSLALAKLNNIASHACGLSGATAFCWGAAGASQLGRVATETCNVGGALSECSAVPASIESDLSFAQLAPGSDHTCGLTTDGEVYCWGSDARRQLGGTLGGTSTAAVRINIKD